MILIAFAICALSAIVLVALSHTNQQMNAAAVGQAIVYLAIAVYILLFVQIPINNFIVGSGYFFIDHLGLLEVLVATCIFLLAAIYARGYVSNLLANRELEPGSLRLFYATWCLLELIIVLAFFSDNLALFWIFAEMTTILSALLIAILSAKENIDAALKYIFVASTAMIFAFVGLIFLYEISLSTLGMGTLNWTELIQHASSFPAGMVTVAFMFVFIGFAAKSGIFPFHTWLPEAHAKAPSAVSAILSGVLLNVGIYGIIRVFAIAHQANDLAVLTPVLLVFAILTIAIAAISMLVEKNLKKLIAFSSIENMGIILTGIAVASPVAIFWVLFQIIGHALTKASLFFSAGILHRQYRSNISPDAADNIHDVFKLQPLAAWGIILGGLAIIGIPPFMVFFSKFFILLSLGSLSMEALAVVLALIFIAAAALGYFVIQAFSCTTPSDEVDDLAAYRTPLSMEVPIVILLTLVLVLGLIFPAGGNAFLNQIVMELKFT